MDNREMEMKELSLGELDQASGGTSLPETWKAQILKDCTVWKKDGYSKERILRAYERYMKAYPEIGTYINSIWDTI